MTKREWMIVGAVILLALLAFFHARVASASVPAGVTQAGAIANAAAGDQETITSTGYGVGGDF